MPLSYRTARFWAAFMVASLLMGVALPAPALAGSYDEVEQQQGELEAAQDLAVCEDLPAFTFADQQAIAPVHKPAVRCMAVYGIVRGVGSLDGLPVFDPGAEVTRQQFASFLGRLIAQAVVATPDVDTVRAALSDQDQPAAPEDPEAPETPDTSDTPDTATTPTFVDVDPANIHAAAIALLVELGITTGVGDGTRFAPAAQVSRQQLASFLARTLDVLGVDAATAAEGLEVAASAIQPATETQPETATAQPQTPHVPTDLDAAAPVHRDDILRLVDLGLIAGFEDGTFRPARAVNRQQLVSLLAATATLLQEAGRWAAPHPSAPPAEAERPETPGTMIITVEPESPDVGETVTVQTEIVDHEGKPVEGVLIQWALFDATTQVATPDGLIDVDAAQQIDRRGTRTGIDGRASSVLQLPAEDYQLLLWASIERTTDLHAAVLWQLIALEVAQPS